MTASTAAQEYRSGVSADRSGESAIVVDGLTKRFENYVAVDELSFNVPKGSVFGFLGPNGAGKTTTIGMLLGLIPIDSGKASILGYDSATQIEDVMMRTGALVERPAFYPYLSGRKNLQIMAAQMGINDQERVEKILHTVDLTERADAKFGGYSTGMKQRLGIAAALISEPELIILDEPTSGLDPAGQREIREIIRGLAGSGRTVFLSSHILQEIQSVCSDVAIIAHGKLVQQGTLSEILTDADQIEVTVDRATEAARVVEPLDYVDQVETTGQALVVNVALERSADVNRELVQAGFAVSQLRHRESQLEERFLSLTENREEA